MRSKVKYLQWSGDGESLWAVLEDGKCNVYKLITKSSVKKSGEYDVGDKPTAACRIVST
ncbi:unnamed protein product [Heligmosomoides polygyrus]|uniref:ANAPC4_WD40 domain-containing protein n=1 Tax=Heligmosomoides polygyrus TaxID=6339 RepID=A0A183FBF1_HELPZ|nr:unnamed protein product [Heligmosomoides polygyrus]